MDFLEAFVDELTKTGGAGGLIRRLGGKLPGLARAAAVGVPAGMAGLAIGKKRGEKEGIAEGTAMTGAVAERAYRAGVERGAEAMQEAILQRQNGAARH